MGLLGKLFGKRRDPEPSPPPPDQPATITVFDEYGRELQIEREVWRREVLPAQLREQWSDPDALASSIIMSLEDGFAADLVDAAKRLNAIDPNPERGTCLYGIVLLETKRIAEAERVLRGALEKQPRSAALLTNLAKVHDAKGETQKSQQVLWQAITADPNFENALLWYASIHHERNPKFGWVDAMQRIAAIEGSWRAKLWLARAALESKNLPAAMELYQKVLVMAADADGALMQISGDLGKAGHLAEILELVFPFYDPARHDIAAGFNFLQAFLETGDWQRGEELLHALMLRDLPPFRERLMWYSTQFSELKQKPPALEPISDLKIEMVQLEQPVWTTALEGPSWLYPANDGAQIAVFAFANTTDRQGLLRENEALVSSEDAIGRLTRAIPLHLSDVLRFRTDARPRTLLPIVVGGGMMVTGRAPDAEDVRAMSNGAPLAIAGTVSEHGEDIQIEVIVWKTDADHPLTQLTERGPLDELYLVWQRIESTLLQLLAFDDLVVLRDADPRFRVPAESFRYYLDGIGQAYSLAISSMNVPSGLYGERNIHRWLLNLALELPDNPMPKIALVSALANSRRGGSQLYREMEKETLKLFENAPARSELRRLSPIVFRLFDRNEEFERRRGEVMHGAEDDYVRWLAAIETTFDASPAR